MSDEIQCVATEDIPEEGEMKTYSQCVNHLCRERERIKRSSFLGDQVQEQSSFHGQTSQSIHQVQGLSPGDKDPVQMLFSRDKDQEQRLLPGDKDQDKMQRLSSQDKEQMQRLIPDYKQQVQRLPPGDKDQVHSVEIKCAGNNENKKRKQLVRQIATIDYEVLEEEKREEESTTITSPDRRLRNKITTLEEESSPSVPNNSSKHQHNKTENIIYSETIDIPSRSTSSPEVVTSSLNKNKEQASILKLKKQKTIESTSSRGGSPRYLPRQYSGASSSSALVSIHPSPSSSTYGPITPKLTLVRGQSCSLVDIPTYLGSSVMLGNVTKVNAVIDNSPDRLQTSKHVNMENIMRLKQEILKSRKKEKPTRKTECILICIALSFLLVCIAMVGTMLSYTTNYQDRAIAETMFYNHNTSYTFNTIDSIN